VIDSIHQSTLSMALRCGEQFRRRYINGEIIPPSIAAARGTGLHKANEVNLKQKIKSKKDLDANTLKDAARDAFLYNLKNGVFLPKEDQSAAKKLINEGLNQCLDLTELYRNDVSPKIQPLEVERPFKIDIGLELPIAGRIDHEQTGEVDDLKTTTRAWAENRINKEVQPIFYSMAHEREFGTRPQFNYHILIALKRSSRHQIQSRTCADSDYRALIYRLQAFLRMYKAGVFPPAEVGAWICSPRWCGYHSTCPYVGNEPIKRWI
jgi:hypothetical protein